MITDLNSFVEMIRMSYLLDDHHIQEMLRKYAGESNPEDESDSLSRFRKGLISEGLLTQWQCDRLSLGKYKGFFFDHYVLLQRLDDGSDADRIYAARNRPTGDIEKLRVVIPSPSKAEFHYEVLQADDD